jgi:urease accessory protein
MFAVTSRFEASFAKRVRFSAVPDYDRGMDGGGGRVESVRGVAPSSLERTSGVGRVRIGKGGVAEIYQQGALRLRLPHRNASDRTEVVAINTAGGLTGGDRLDLAVQLDAGASAVLTTPACEKIYRSAAGDATVTNTISLGEGARLDWLPQPLIVFDGGRVRRTLDVALAPTAAMFAVEGTILGRTAMSEDVRTGALHDAWRIRRGGALVYADAFRAEGDSRSALAGAATLRGARAFATAVYVGPDAESRLDDARGALAEATGSTGASAWNGILVARFLAADGQALIADLGAFLARFRGTSLPRSWLC